MDGTASTPPSDSSQAPPISRENADSTYEQELVAIVTDLEGDPLEGVNVFLSYQQHNPFQFRSERFSGTTFKGIGPTDARGRVESSMRLSEELRETHAQLVLVTPGHAIVVHEVHASLRNREPLTARVTLRPSSPLRLRVIGSNGKPAQRMSVFPFNRTDLNDRSSSLPETLLLNEVAPDSAFADWGLRKQTNDNGEVVVDWFEPRDLATLSVKPRGGSLEQGAIHFEVPSDSDQVVTITQQAGGRGDFGGGEFGGGLGAYQVNVGDSEEATGTKPAAPRGGGRRRGFPSGGGSEYGGGYGGFGGGAYGSSRPATNLTDLTGAVRDADGAPIANADVLLIVKTWPNGRFRQDDYTLKTDAEGRFVLKGKIPRDAKYGVNAAIVAQGHAIASKYVLEKDPGGGDPGKLFFLLPKTEPMLLSVADSQGGPVAGALVIPSSRATPESEQHNVYFQGSEPVQRSTDRDGNVEVDWFAKGDTGRVWVMPQGGEWSEHNVAINGSTASVILE